MSRNKAIFYAVLAAFLYALNAPVSKLLLSEIPSTMLAALLYLGAGIGVLGLSFFYHNDDEKPLTKADWPYTIAMVGLDIVAPIALMIGLKTTTAANASLINNFEIVATSLIALFIFHEKISKKLWTAIILVTLSSMILSFEDISSLSFSTGSFFVLLACCFWGLENNCTRELSSKNPMHIVIIKGFGSGLGSFIIAMLMNESLPKLPYLLIALLLGFFAYGLSIYFYICAQRNLGAAKTSTYYALSPFIGAGLSLLIFKQLPSLSFLIALIIMIAGTYLTLQDE